MTSRALASLFVLALGCGPHSLEIDLSLLAPCPTSVPAGGSLLYEIAIDAIADAPARVCGACIAVETPITNAEDVLALVRSGAPSCPLPREATMQVRVTSFAGPTCTLANAGTAPRICGASDKLTAGDGHGDQSIAVALSCQIDCNLSTCVPIPCSAQGKNCDWLSNGCGQQVYCGDCPPSQKCGGGGVDHVCGK